MRSWCSSSSKRPCALTPGWRDERLAMKKAADLAARAPFERAGGAEQRAIVRRAGIVATGTLTSRILGLGREQVLAAMFNRFETDAFAIAFLLPNLLRQLLAEGAVQTGVLPVLAATRETSGDAAARDLFRRLRGLSLLI